MAPSLFSYIAWFLALIVAQVVVCNHIHLLGYAMPMIYVYFLMILPGRIARWALLVIAFVLGIVVDMFSSTPGMASSALLLTALLRPMVLTVFAPVERRDGDFIPSVRTMEWGGFMRYAVAISLLHTSAFYIIEAFSFFHLSALLWSIFSSTLLTTLLILALEMLRNKR
ncbi:MAG: rod shape-determining protein MreD [Bacteroidaceae bacterium]|jgi:hypothetical protein|nr:rod shape-determining protein MreD [Bacteroidaceae bacterium]